MQGWGTHIGRPQDQIKNPTSKDQWIRYWCEQQSMQVPSKSGRLVTIDIYYASSGAAECVGGRVFDSLVSMQDKAFFVLFVQSKTEIVAPSFRPILCIPKHIEAAWWVLPQTEVES